MEMNGKKQAKVSFNIIDVLILVFVIACFVGLIMRIGNFSIFNNDRDLDEYRIHFSVSDISSESTDYFITGDNIMLSDRGVSLGRLEMIDSIAPVEVTVRTEDNSFKSVKYPSDTRVNISGTIVSMGTSDHNGFKLGGTLHVAPGESFDVKSEHMNFTLTVTNIVKK